MNHWSFDEFLNKQKRRVSQTARRNFSNWKNRISSHISSEPLVIVRGSVGSDAHVNEQQYDSFSWVTEKTMKKFLLVIFLILFGTKVNAQVLVNPTAVEFKSDDHTVVDGAGNPILTEYIIEYYLGAAATPLSTSTFAKTLATSIPVNPSCSANCYRVLFSALPSYPIGVDLSARVRSRGPAGTSNPSSLSAETFRRPVPVPAVPTNFRIVQ